GEAVRFTQSDASSDIRALETLVAAYLGKKDEPTEIDWGFLGIRQFQAKPAWAAEDGRRHKLALAALAATGYEQTKEVAAEAAADELDDEDSDEDGDFVEGLASSGEAPRKAKKKRGAGAKKRTKTKKKQTLRTESAAHLSLIFTRCPTRV